MHNCRVPRGRRLKDYLRNSQEINAAWNLHGHSVILPVNPTMRSSPKFRRPRAGHLFALPGIAAVALAGCDVKPLSESREQNSRSTRPVVPMQDVKQRQVAFLNRIREADPQARTIDRALLNEQNELGLVLDRSVEMDRIPALMRTMLTQMAGEFPGEDLTVLAYTPSSPPRKIGTARLKASTTEMTYTTEN